ncbi:MAG: PA3611 family quorum-sensing-regulated virulence factor [Halopseudomonas yangmingensis]|uniref:Quorum-sensing-regulated virulence factor n=1 Tax=Halopseudomonas yangmingensis TaxID=1720063 RepID=A0A1I4U7J7_9GAMM|nr:PA3611 family quorum-sensing-regulated virulence factor [Halopseudomonas yangmingensis]SFM84927.1 Putative quorum-sensing-regulated virulence factor [Halopseudomonas yangmingensis]
MMRTLVVLIISSLSLTAHATSLRDLRLQETLSQVAEQSSENTPRAINDDLTDEGYSAQGNELVNLLSARPDYAARLQADPLLVRSQLQASICSDLRLRRLLDMGATLTYHFVVTGNRQPVLTQSFIAEHCQTL